MRKIVTENELVEKLNKLINEQVKENNGIKIKNLTYHSESTDDECNWGIMNAQGVIPPSLHDLNKIVEELQKEFNITKS
jgi:hypothetical protein